MKTTKRKYVCDCNMTLEEVAQEFGVSRQRIEQLEKRAIAKLKKALYDRFGESVTLADILPMLPKGEYNAVSRLRLPSE